MQGFQWPCQKEILGPYTERYFSDIEKIYTVRDVHYSAAFGMFLFPVWDHSRSLLEDVEKFLAEKKELPFLLRKELMTHADNLKRAIPIIEKQDVVQAG
jgi:aminopeptidase N